VIYLPIVPLRQADYNSDENRNLIDVYNDNFRQLDWLLNKIKLDSQNIQTKIEFTETEINSIKQKILDKVSADSLTEDFISQTQQSLQSALGDLAIQFSNAQSQFYQLTTQLVSTLEKTDEYIKKELDNFVRKADEKKLTIEEEILSLFNSSETNLTDIQENIKALFLSSNNDINEMEQVILDLISNGEADFDEIKRQLKELLISSKDELTVLTNDINILLTNANDKSSELNRLLLLADETSNPLNELIDKLENLNGNIELLTPQQKEIIGNLAEIFDKGMFDTLGMNAKYLKFYPNRAYNSSFECFDETTLTPYYWYTDGTVSKDSLYAESYSLKLTPNQIARHENTLINGVHNFSPTIQRQGLIDVSWWTSWCERTRVSFRAKTTALNNPNSIKGRVYIECFAVDSGGSFLGVLTPFVWENNIEKKVLFEGYTQEVALEWIDGLVSVAFHHPKALNRKRIKILIRNVGQVDIFIDAVQVEPDFTGKWASFYSDGLESTPSLTSIADNSITDKKIVDNAITTSKVFNNAITTNKIVDNAITTNKIVDNGITTNKIVDNAIVTSKVTDNAITEAKLSNEVKTKINQIGSTQPVLADNSIMTKHIQNSAITESKIGNGAVTENKLDSALRQKLNDNVARFG
jgi:uncharacterized protein YukE